MNPLMFGSKSRICFKHLVLEGLSTYKMSMKYNDSVMQYLEFAVINIKKFECRYTMDYYAVGQ